MQNNHHGIDLAELDPILGPVLASSNGSANRRVLALLCKGISREVPVEAIRLWIKSRCVDGYMFGRASDAIGGRHDPNEHRGRSRSRRSRDIAHDMRGLADSRGWSPLVDSARERVISSSGDGRDGRGASLDIALRIVAGVLTPLPEPRKTRELKQQGTRSRTREAAIDAKRKRAVRIEKVSVARAVLMTMGLRILNEEPIWDTTRASQPWLAAELGLDVQVVARAFDLLENRGLITRPLRQAYVTTRTRVVALGKKKKAAQVWSDVATQLLDGTATPIVVVLRSVAHPAWTYSDKLEARHWLMLLADTAGLEPSTLGISRQMAVTLREDLVETGYDWSPAVMVPYLDEILDRLADDIAYGTKDKTTKEPITARLAKERAMAAYLVSAGVHKEEAQAASQRKKAGYMTLDALLEVHPVPKSPFDRRLSAKIKAKREQAVRAWVADVHGVVTSESWSGQARELVGHLLTKRLVKAGYPQAFAEALVGYVMHAPNDATLDDWMALSDEVIRSAIAGEVPFECAVEQSGAAGNSLSQQSNELLLDADSSGPSRRRESTGRRLMR